MPASITFYNGTGADLKIQTSSGKSITTFPGSDTFTGGDYIVNDKYTLSGESLKALIEDRSYLNIDFETNLVVKNPVSQSTFGANNTTVQAAHNDNTWIMVISIGDEKIVSCTEKGSWVEQKYSDFISESGSAKWIILVIVILLIILVIIGGAYLAKRKGFIR